MTPSLGCFVVGFKEEVAYSSETAAGLINTLVGIAASVAIWTALYRGGATTGMPQASLVTYVALMIALRSVFEMDDLFVERRVRKGLIGQDLLRPLPFRQFLLSYMGGGAVARIAFQLAPSLALVALFIDLQPPPSVGAVALSLASIALGYLVLFNLNFMLWVSSFWLHATWSLVTIKEAVILVLSGVVFPLWLMPPLLRDLIALTPFEAIMHTPVAIYLGAVSGADAWIAVAKQVAWLVALHLVGNVLLARGQRHVVVQGG